MKVKFPLVSLTLMIIYAVIGTLLILLPMPMGPAHIDWGVWGIAYLGYIYIILAAILYIKKGK